MKKILYIIVVTVMFASCSKESNDLGGSSANVPIEFGSAIQATTRTIDNSATQFGEGDKIGVIGYCADVAGATTDFSAPLLDKVEFSYGGEKFSAASGANWQLGKVHNFYAYYPSDLTVAQVKGVKAAPTAALFVIGETGVVSDVMHAKVEGATKFESGAAGVAQLNFKHRLSKVMFRIMKGKATDVDPVVEKIEFAMEYSKGTYNVATGGVILDDSPEVILSKTMNQTITSTTGEDLDAQWIVLPNDKIKWIRFTIDSKVLEATIDNGMITTGPGIMTVVTLTVQSSSIDFNSSTLEEWGDTSGSGEVKPPVVASYFYTTPKMDVMWNNKTGKMVNYATIG